MLLDRPSYPRNIDRMRASASRFFFFVSELLELLDDLVDGPWEHPQAFRNASRSDAVNEKSGLTLIGLHQLITAVNAPPAAILGIR